MRFSRPYEAEVQQKVEKNIITWLKNGLVTSNFPALIHFILIICDIFWDSLNFLLLSTLSEINRQEYHNS